MPIRWTFPLESGVRCSPSGELPCHLLTFSPFRPGGPAGPRGPGSPGRPCKRENLSPWGCKSDLGTHSHCSPDPLCQPCWLRGSTYWGSRIPSRYCPIYKSRGALQREQSAPVLLPSQLSPPQHPEGLQCPWTLKGCPSNRAEESGKCTVTHPFPSVTLFSLQE